MSETSKKNNETIGFLSHLIELRDRLLRVVIVVGIAFAALFPFASDIYDWLAAPLGQGMIIIGPVAPFLIPMKLALLVAFLITLPYLLYQLWSFVAPGLYKHEKRLVYPLLASSVFLFYLGIIFVYFVLLPMMFQVIPGFVPQTAEFKPDIAQYLDFVVMMFMAFGISFEMPIATILLITTGMTTAEKLKQKRPYVIVGAFVLGMILTPPDVISQIMLAIPMWILFELGIIASKFFKIRVEEAGEAKEAREKADDDAHDAKATAATSAAYLPPDDLWSEDDSYTYAEDDGSSNDDTDDGLSDEERSILGNDPLEEDINDDEYRPEDDESEETFFDSDGDDFEELSDEEMDAELDSIEAQEKAEKAVQKKAKKRAKKKEKADKSKPKDNKN
jgi:sec-independent protein translocase protein TatC